MAYLDGSVVEDAEDHVVGPPVESISRRLYLRAQRIRLDLRAVFVSRSGSIPWATR